MDGVAVACGDFHQARVCWHGHGHVDGGGTELGHDSMIYITMSMVVPYFEMGWIWLPEQALYKQYPGRSCIGDIHCLHI